MPARPLDGIRVVELAQLVSGPYCGTLLAHLGAEVLKIEPPNGDMARQFGPFVEGESAYFHAVNRGKRSEFLDLSSPPGRAELDKHLANADVLVHNMRVDAARRLGVDGDQIRERFPQLVVCEVAAFGSDGPSSDRVGVDLIFQAEAGFMHVTGHPGGQPTRGGTNVPDFLAALSATAGVLAALMERTRSGGAPIVRVSLMDVTVAMQTCWFAAHTAGTPITKLGNASVFSAPTGTYPAADREVVISIVHNRHWEKLCEILGAPEVAKDPRFATNDLRCQHRSELDDQIRPLFLQRTGAEWAKELSAAGLPVALANTYDEVIAHWPNLFDWSNGYAVAGVPFRLIDGPDARFAG